MKIFFAASEMTPYAKTGGLGDVVGALSSELSRRGHEVTCCLPYYRCAREAAARQDHEGRRFTRSEASERGAEAPLHRHGNAARASGVTVDIPLGSGTVTGDVLELKQRDGVRVLFIRRDEFFDRAELYYTGERDYEDNAARFLFFAKAVVELIGHKRFRPDVVHCHDWQAAMVPVLMRHKAEAGGQRQQARRLFNKAPGTTAGGTPAPLPKTVLTIHNMAYQGLFGSGEFGLTNLPAEYFTSETLEFYGRMNLLKGGIVFADAITTVSKTYAKEILTEEGGCGLETVLATRAGELHGIVNGVDYAEWNPETDGYLKQNYGPADLTGKRACREDLLERMGLNGGAATGQARGPAPTISCVAAFVSRLTEQKGVEVLAGAMVDLVRSGLIMVILGRGERKYEEMLARAAGRFPGQVAVRIAHDEELAHRIQGGADILLMPSHFEPCGLTQLYAMKYGTIPVVRATGGLADTVAQYRAGSGGGTGFKFAPYTCAALVEAVHQAILLHKQPKKWEKLMRNAMACDFSWQAGPARGGVNPVTIRAGVKEYEKLYAAL